MKLFGFTIPLLLLGVVACSATTLFYESFEESWVGRWHPSSKEDYKGVWKHEKSRGQENYGLLVSERAKKYGISTLLSKEVEFKDRPIVLQYDVRFLNGLMCSGAYLKFLTTQPEGWTPDQLDSGTRYSIMFGPDKCGSTEKVHFIFKHKDPKSGIIREHHMIKPPTPIDDRDSHVYTAVIYPNNTVNILIDGELKKSADMLSLTDFDPAVLVEKTIPDPDDKRPEDWDNRAMIPDPNVKKPDDWDEDAPEKILDMDATMPHDWLEDEPVELDDPDAVKPENWDEEEDGPWQAPRFPNPNCVRRSGCGEWKRPMKKNPNYKGKWFAPWIENPKFKGIWQPRDIPNPEYVHLDKANLQPISAIAIEIWTMENGILFDNVLITDDEEIAKEYRLKSEAEKAQTKQELETTPHYDEDEADDTIKQEEEDEIEEADEAKQEEKEVINETEAEQTKQAVDKIEKKLLNPNQLNLGLVISGGGAGLLLLLLLLAVVVFFLNFKVSVEIKPAKDSKRVTGRAKKEDITAADDDAAPAPASSEKLNNDNISTVEVGEKGEADQGPRQRKPSRQETS